MRLILLAVARLLLRLQNNLIVFTIQLLFVRNFCYLVADPALRFVPRQCALYSAGVMP